MLKVAIIAVLIAVMVLFTVSIFVVLQMSKDTSEENNVSETDDVINIKGGEK